MWVAATFLEEVTADLELASLEPDFITAFLLDNTLITVRERVQVASAPTWSDYAGLSPELRSWQLQFGNLSVDSDDRLWRRRRRLHSWWFLSVRAAVLFRDIMIPYSLDVRMFGCK